MAIPSGTFRTDLNQGIPVFSVDGYFADQTGKALQDAIRPFLFQGKTTVILDLLNCTTVNSQGVGWVLMISLEVVEEFGGKFFITGMDKLKSTVFALAGINIRSTFVNHIEDVFDILKNP